MITVIIADDHQIFRQGLRLLLGSDDRFQLLGEARNGLEALELIDKFKPDVAVLDLSMPRPDGIEVAARLTAGGSSTRCIILTMKDELYSVRRAIDVGARGYLLKETAFEEVAEAIVRIAAGQRYFGPLENDPRLFPESGSGLLSPREQEILHHVARGFTNKEIADLLCLSHRTVETHRHKLMQKLGLRTTAALISYAREQGLV